jgi:hypothetical protein
LAGCAEGAFSHERTPAQTILRFKLFRQTWKIKKPMSSIGAAFGAKKLQTPRQMAICSI